MRANFHGIGLGIVAAVWIGWAGAALAQGGATESEQALAARIRQDARLSDVVDRAKKVVASGFTAGDGYGEVWIRDLNTFMELACVVHPAATVRERLLLFFHFQGEDGNIVDGYIPKSQTTVGYTFILSETAPDFAAHKNTVETDQESSLVLGVCKYARATGDLEIFSTPVNGQTVSERLERALRYVRTHRFADQYGLVWGGTTADWGDVQPEHEWGVVLDSNSHRAIDIYDNALYLCAIDEFLKTAPNLSSAVRDEWQSIHQAVAQNVRRHLWDADRRQFIPHLYLDGSPFPADFNEREIYYHGGTAVAIEAGLLTREEVGHALARMVENKRAAGAASIGITQYPPYPAGFFKNPAMAKPYSYQNGGDWTWFGARMIRQLARYGYIEEAYRELDPMVQRVIDNGGFHEWYSVDNKPRGSGEYRGAAGVLYAAIVELQASAATR